MNIDSRFVKVLRGVLLTLTAFTALVSVAADKKDDLTNIPPKCDPERMTCTLCPGGGDQVEDGCILIQLAAGSTTPWTGSQSAMLKVFADTKSPMVFTTESIHAVLGYTYKRIGNAVLPDCETPKEVVFTHPNGQPITFVFDDDATTARPGKTPVARSEERLMMVDAAGWAVTRDPVYWDLYAEDGRVFRFLATEKSGERGRLVYVKDSRGVVTTPEDMGIDIVYDANGIRQLLTPSRLANIVTCADGFDITVYPLSGVPAKTSGLYRLPQAAPVSALKLRRENSDARAVVTYRSGTSDERTYVYRYVDNDWSLDRPSGVREVKALSATEGVGAVWSKDVVDANGRVVSRSVLYYGWENDTYSLTNKTEGIGDARSSTTWDNVVEGNGVGKIRTEYASSGLRTDYEYDEASRQVSVIRFGVDMATNVVEYSYASVDPSDVVPPVDARPRTTVKKVDGVEVERTYHVYGPWSEITERAATQGAAYGAAGALRTVKTYWDADSGVKAGKVKSIRREDGRVDAYDYTLADGIWTETVTHLHEQATEPVSGKTTRDVSVMNGRGENLEYRTEAFVAGTWYTVAKTMQEYNAQGKVIRSTDLAGRVTTTAWDCCHKISETKPDGQTTTWDYDTEGRMIASSRLIPLDATNVTWVTTCYRYDALGRQTATWTTNYTEHVGIPATTTSYDGLGRVISRTIPGLGTSTIRYSANGLVVTNIAPNGATSVTRRNSDGDTLSITGTGVMPEFYSRGVLADGTRWTKTVQGETADSPRFTKSYENMLGATVRSEKSGFRGAVLASVNTYDSYGRLVSSASEGEPTSEIAYDTLGNRTATTTSVGGELRSPRNDGPREWRKSESHSAYALLGNDIWAVQTNVVSCSDSTIPALTQSRASRVTGLTPALVSESLVTDARGNTSESRVEFDGFESVNIGINPAQTGRAESHSRLGVAVRSVSATGVESRSLYDGLGRQIASVDGRGKTTRTEYDSFGRQAATVDADNKRTTYGYDNYGQLVKVINPLGDAVNYSYDLRGHKTYEGGATYPVRYAYDLFGNKSSMTTYRNAGKPVGDTTCWLYDEASNCMTNKVYADGNGTKYDYDTYGRLTKRTWARGIETTYSYDAWGNLVATAYSDNTPTVTLCYDVMGRQTRAVDAAGVTTFAYDQYGANTNETVVGVAGTNTIERFYDAFGRDTGYALNGVRQSTLAYDPVTGHLSTMRIGDASTNWGCGVLAAPEFSWNYLANSDLKSSLTYPNGLTASWTYGNRGELLEVNNALADCSISKYDYTYDAVGRRVACAKSGTAFEQSDSVNYGYNARSELTSATAAVDSDYRYGYDFDDIGNRKTSSERGTNSVYTASQLNQYTTVNDFTPTYDADGNETLVKTATGIWQITYNGENRPVRWTQGDTVITMSFDRMGRRVTKNDQRFVYNGYLQIADNSGNTYAWDCTENVATRPLAWKRGTSVAYYTHDGNKNVSEVIASNNDVAAHYEYAPFGALTASRGASAADNPWRFSSEYAEDDTATVYYNYRHYEPVTGRWMQRDPIEERGGMNMYCWIMNRSFGVDVRGLWRKKEGANSIWIAEEGDTLRGLAKKVSGSELDWSCLWPVGKTEDHGYPDKIWPCDEYSSVNLDATSGGSLTIALQAGLGMYDNLPQAATLAANLVPARIRDSSGEGGTPIHQLLIGGHGGTQTHDSDDNVSSSYSVSDVTQLGQRPTFSRAKQKKGPCRCWFTRSATARISGCTTESVAQQFASQLLRRGATAYGTDRVIGTGIENGRFVLYYDFDTNNHPANSSEYYSSDVWKSFGGQL